MKRNTILQTELGFLIIKYNELQYRRDTKEWRVVVK